MTATCAQTPTPHLGSGNEGKANACVSTGWLNQGSLYS
jgi:hypothetical protein